MARIRTVGRRLVPVAGLTLVAAVAALTAPGLNGAPARSGGSDVRATAPAAPAAVAQRPVSLTDELDDLAGTERPAPGAAAAPPWAPRDPLPPAATDARPMVVVLAPHPDDETLSLGVWIAEAAHRGDRVIVVALTDGRSTGAARTLAVRLGAPVSRDRVATSRVAELRQATVALGVAPSDLFLAHLDTATSDGGTRATVAEVRSVIRTLADRFPTARFATMSWTAERHPDHLDAGIALWQAVAAHEVPGADFAVSRLWWALPSPPVTVVRPTTPEVRREVELAAQAYGVWDPAHARLAVGWTSVRSQFDALLADPVAHLHGWADITTYPTGTPLPPRPTPTPTPTLTPHPTPS